RFPIKDSDKELVVINIHNSAYDSGGVLKAQQMAYLKEFVQAEYANGHYIVAGGDWNQCPPYFRYDGFSPTKEADPPTANIAADFLPEDWQWVYDPTMPTVRHNQKVYKAGETFVTLIDFFLISPNLRAIKVKGVNHNFQASDHQPVWMEVELL
ncbi:MAG: endonuclease/exonuclease/phosphatase family protein, partial [Bacteroidota bacterium]